MAYKPTFGCDKMTKMIIPNGKDGKYWKNTQQQQVYTPILRSLSKYLLIPGKFDRKSNQVHSGFYLIPMLTAQNCAN